MKIWIFQFIVFLFHLQQGRTRQRGREREGGRERLGGIKEVLKIGNRMDVREKEKRTKKEGEEK